MRSSRQGGSLPQGQSSAAARARSGRTDMLRLAAFAAVFMGWQFFPDGPLAYYIACGALIAALCIERAHSIKTKTAWIVYGYGAAMGSMSAACGGLYAEQADGYSILCDKGTGLPVSLISGSLLLVAAAYVYKQGNKNG